MIIIVVFDQWEGHGERVGECARENRRKLRKLWIRSGCSWSLGGREKEGGVHALGLPFWVRAGKMGGEAVSGLLWRREPLSNVQKDETQLGHTRIMEE